jgi:hypothetical protein
MEKPKYALKFSWKSRLRWEHNITMEPSKICCDNIKKTELLRIKFRCRQGVELQ